MNDLVAILYPYLFGVIPIVFLWVKNLTEVPITVIVKVGASYTVVFCGAYGILLWLTDNYQRAGFIFFIMTIFFYKGGRWWRQIVKSQNTLTCWSKLFRVLLLGGLLLINNTMIFTFFGIIILVVCAFVLLMFIVKIIENYSAKEANATDYTEAVTDTCVDNVDNIGTNKIAALPDIYFIVPDSYAGNKSLKQYYNFDNREFLGWLSSKGFKVYDEALSNYTFTNLSVTSTLNFDYLDNVYTFNPKISYIENRRAFNARYFDNRVFNYLYKRGYHCCRIMSGWERSLVGYENARKIGLMVECDLQYALREFMTNLFSDSIISIINLDGFGARRKELNRAFSEIEKTIEMASPKFIYAHILCPHAPYSFDEFGNLPKISSPPSVIEQQKAYIGQMKYINQRLQNTIDKILLHNKDSIIIVQGDHGHDYNDSINHDNWRMPTDDFLNEKSDILRAIYLPSNINLNADIKTSVNLFRALINTLFNEDLPLLPDKFFHSNFESQSDFFCPTNVTERIIALNKDEL